MKLKDRVVIISEKNMDRMNALGKCTTEELERIVNNMIENAIIEINEDKSMTDKVTNCNQCKYMKAYDYGNKIYYCDHEDRTDDMGKLSVVVSPKWCPLRDRNK
ncbi:MAG: hypothetical protein HFH74_05290 [Lachnospiraceae bacterium]|jgi:hypothetical protein|nr:hypothetical protein [Lachnospiraceae bacterium]